MTTLRTALLVATAALAALPTLAAAQSPPEQNRDWHGRDDRGDRGDHGDRGNHAPPPGAQPGQPAPAGRANPGNGPDRRGPDGRDDRGFQGDRRGFAPVDRHPDDRGDRNFQGDRRGFAPVDRRDDRPPQNDRRGYDGRGGPDWRGGDWNRGHDNGYDRQPGWDRGRAAGWRQDRRYDWHGWRDQNRDLFRGPRYIAPRGFAYRPYSVGFRLQPFFYSRTYWIDDPYAYRLPPADGPYRWVRYYNDVLLIDLRNGAIVDVIRQFFW